MLPEPAQKPILHLLRDYAAVRIGLGIPGDPAKRARDVARSVESKEPTVAAGRDRDYGGAAGAAGLSFVGAPNEMNNIHESRLTALRYHVPGTVTVLVIAVAMVAAGFTGYYAGHRAATFVMSLTIAAVILLVIDLDRTPSGLIRVPVQALIDAQQAIPP
jgi:hypothetical protein